ncbi:tripartite tricarboxylate transporter substrate binding protein [Azospirillum sp. RWY-5-1]|uniref:Tripartite tricarboxylate transporter substrate binding protein n=1 Tax=Azospirillum oleiclasticum TaxID=2735135 RepID=A0ABX2TIZ3_9PROT|nr:tripartite tricarboxylate transporter substrate binding protein [Azospirillum oleiclasticum]NYZ14539.1 tripartite tricarboxylate transporter substrate binding protein [Azospirillum oleiclasticum]NYZ24317.1 tripartite tricarboxylate transporter substrate binding protein [Azospirillum oleiclasticum]
MLDRRGLLISAAHAAVLAGLPAARAAEGQAWEPKKPIRVVIGYGAGGSTDAIGRLTLRKVEEQRGWKFIVENKSGAQGALAAIDVKNAPADGYTIGLLSTGNFALDPFLVKTAQYMPEDIDYIGTIAKIEYALVAAKDAPYNNLVELAAHTKKNGPVSFSSTGKILDLAMERVSEKLGIAFVSAPTSGSAQSVQLVLGGHANVTISGGVHVPYIQDGRLKVLASMTNGRADYAPGVATSLEQGGGYAIKNYFLFVAPKNMPADVKATLADAIDAAVKSPEIGDYAAKTFNTRINLGAKGSADDVMAQSREWREWLPNAKSAK